jgi:hypothetical protein
MMMTHEDNKNQVKEGNHPVDLAIFREKQAT